MLQHVFISYRHESPEHARTVRRLGELLCQAKLPVELDQFHLEACPGGPDEGWPKWCEDRANNSACVVIVGSAGWFSAYDKIASPGVGLGAATEADLFRQDFWDHQGNNNRIRLAFLHDVAAESVPVRLRAWHQFRPFDSDDQLNQLIRWVAACLGVSNIELPTVRWPAPLPFQPDLANRIKEEWPAIVDLLAGRSRERILLYEGASGLGKSAIVRQAAVYAGKLGIPVVRVDLKGGGTDVESMLGQFDLDLGQHLPNFFREGASKTHLLRKDLRGLRQPVLVIFDTYEGCAQNKPVVDWLTQQFLAEVETALGLAVIIAGQQVPDPRGTGWRDLVRHLPLKPITEIQYWEPWVEQHYPDFQRKGADLATVLMYAGGNPMIVSTVCETIAKR
jgi:SEFIR domain